MNSLKQSFLSGGKSIGTFCLSSSDYMIEGAAMAGFDYVVIDNEHSPIDAETSSSMIKSAELHGITPICRVKEISRSSILKLLDVGAQGLIIPNVKTVEDVNKVIEFAKYPPIGKRGFSPSRKDGWSFRYNMTVAESMAFYNEETLIIPQCETAEALDCIEEILALEGVDGVFIGPFDLSIALGIPGEFKSEKFRNAVDRIVSACRMAGKLLFMFAGDAQSATLCFNWGVNSVSLSSEIGIFIQSGRDILGHLRNEI